MILMTTVNIIFWLTLLIFQIQVQVLLSKKVKKKTLCRDHWSMRHGVINFSYTLKYF
jgi:hypothetical protein